MTRLTELGDPNLVLELEPEELAPIILRHLQQQKQQINRYNFSLVTDRTLVEQLGRNVEAYALDGESRESVGEFFGRLCRRDRDGWAIGCGWHEVEGRLFGVHTELLHSTGVRKSRAGAREGVRFERSKRLRASVGIY